MSAAKKEFREHSYAAGFHLRQTMIFVEFCENPGAETTKKIAEKLQFDSCGSLVKNVQHLQNRYTPQGPVH